MSQSCKFSIKMVKKGKNRHKHCYCRWTDLTRHASGLTNCLRIEGGRKNTPFLERDTKSPKWLWCCNWRTICLRVVNSSFAARKNVNFMRVEDKMIVASFILIIYWWLHLIWMTNRWLEYKDLERKDKFIIFEWCTPPFVVCTYQSGLTDSTIRTVTSRHPSSWVPWQFQSLLGWGSSYRSVLDAASWNRLGLRFCKIQLWPLIPTTT